ncbi:MAG TPA: SpoIIE family protein phosphatase, partial [Vicinamibacterales bacterium]|nr:SpoIIE family protein phosphatase [Vicinamibacterales bacterium]
AEASGARGQDFRFRGDRAATASGRNPRAEAGGRGAPAPVTGAPQTRPRDIPQTPGALPAAPPPPGAPRPAEGSADDQAGALADRMLIDMRPIREGLIKQLVPDGELGKLTPEQRANLGREINARMMGIAQGIRLSAEELQKRAQDAQKQALAAEKTGAAVPSVTTTSPSGAASTTAVTPKTRTTPRTATTAETPRTQQAPPAPAAPPPPPMTRKTAISGNKLGVIVEQDGKVVREVNAEINMPNVLATVFSTTRRDRGEIPFAIAKDGQLYTQSEADRRTIASLGAVATPDGPATARTGNWIVVTTSDPSGSGLKMGIARPVGDSLNSLRLTAARNAGLGLGLIGLALVGIVPLSGRLTRNVTALSDGVKRIAEGDYSARVPVRSQDEVGRLAKAFNHMAEEVERHHRSAVEQERIKRELELGRLIQFEMLPHAPLRLGLLEVKGVSVPAREVGGDFFNYFELPNHKLALLVGDVSGKGVGAALLMANIQASLRTRLALGQDLSAIANAIDEDVESSSPGPVYATLFVGILDPATRLLQYVNAGHHPQYVVRKNGGLDVMSSTGLPVGLLAGRGYRASEVQLEAGDLLFFYTDGCVETEDAAGEFFGAERLESVLAQRDPARGIDDLLQHVERDVSAFRGSTEQFDDATMMAVTIG